MENLDEDIWENEADTLKGRYLTFKLDDELFGLEIRFVTEIIGIQPITEMPEMPEYIKGIINLRGRIIPLMDIRLRFGKSPREYDDRTCIIVIDFNGVSIGFIVDSVAEVLTISDEDISERPVIAGGGSCGYVKNIGNVANHVVLLLDCGHLLSSDEIDGISRAI